MLLGSSVDTTHTSELVVWRDSVCASDDCDAPHELGLATREESLRSLAARLSRQSYLASIARGRATWILETHRKGGRALAVFAQQWSQPRFLVDPELPVVSYIEHGATPHLYFRYWCQVEPERVFACLQRGEPLPDIYGRDR
jgi:hypothetical protein